MGKSSDKRHSQWSAAKAGEWKKEDKSPSKSWSDSKDSKDSKSWSTDKRDAKWSSRMSGDRKRRKPINGPLPRNLNERKRINPKMNGHRRNTVKTPSRGLLIRRRVENGINLRKRNQNGKRIINHIPNHGLIPMIPKITNHGHTKWPSWKLKGRR